MRVSEGGIVNPENRPILDYMRLVLMRTLELAQEEFRRFLGEFEGWLGFTIEEMPHIDWRRALDEFITHWYAEGVAITPESQDSIGECLERCEQIIVDSWRAQTTPEEFAALLNAAPTYGPIQAIAAQAAAAARSASTTEATLVPGVISGADETPPDVPLVPWRGSVEEVQKEASDLVKAEAPPQPDDSPLIEGWNQIAAGRAREGESDYLVNAAGTIFVGDRAETETNVLGAVGSVAFGLTGMDAYKDISDISYGFEHWKWSWGHAGNQLLNVVGVIPVIGAVKNLKHVDEVLDTGKAGLKSASHADEVAQVAKAAPARTYQTYTKIHPTTGEVYSGRTSGTGTPTQNVARRDQSHHKNKEGFGPAKIDRSATNSDAIRGREQNLIGRHGGAKAHGGTSGNIYNGISQLNRRLQEYLDAARNLFGE